MESNEDKKLTELARGVGEFVQKMQAQDLKKRIANIRPEIYKLAKKLFTTALEFMTKDYPCAQITIGLCDISDTSSIVDGGRHAFGMRVERNNLFRPVPISGVEKTTFSTSCDEIERAMTVIAEEHELSNLSLVLKTTVNVGGFRREAITLALGRF